MKITHVIDDKLKGHGRRFFMVLGNRYKHREAKYQFKKFSKNLEEYVLRDFQNPEDIIILVQDIKDPMAVLNKSITTEIST